MKHERIDFYRIEPIHLGVHARLLNWARWVRPGRGSTGLQPMFRQYRSTETTTDPQDAAIPVDGADGMRVEKIICGAGFPEKGRAALQWNYVYGFIEPRKVCRHLSVSEGGLLSLVKDGRAMVKSLLHDTK